MTTYNMFPSQKKNKKQGKQIQGKDYKMIIRHYLNQSDIKLTK